MEPGDVALVAAYSDILQIGARNMQNFPLLKEAGRSQKPVLLKRGMSATIDEWLIAAEYILSRGNFQVILCERGIRTFETMARNTLDLDAVPVHQRLTHLPIVVDPATAPVVPLGQPLALRGDRRRGARPDRRGPPQPGRRPVRRPAVADAGELRQHDGRPADAGRAAGAGGGACATTPLLPAFEQVAV